MFVVQHLSSTGQLLSLGLSDLSPSTIGNPPNSTSEAYSRGRPTDTRIFSYVSRGRGSSCVHHCQPNPQRGPEFHFTGQGPIFSLELPTLHPKFGSFGEACAERKEEKLKTSQKEKIIIISRSKNK